MSNYMEMAEKFRAVEAPTDRPDEPFDADRLTVTVEPWSVSYHDAHDEDFVSLSIFYIDYEQTNRWGGKGVPVHHPASGERFTKAGGGARTATLAAREFAYWMGVVRYYDGTLYGSTGRSER